MKFNSFNQVFDFAYICDDCGKKDCIITYWSDAIFHKASYI